MEESISTQPVLPQLTCEIDNLGKSGKNHNKNLIYTTTDAQQNNLEFIITTNQDAQFSPGKAVPISNAGKGTGSLLYLDFSTLNLTPEEFDAITLGVDTKKSPGTLQQWTFCKYTDTMTICMTPKKAGTLTTSDQVVISIKELGIANPPAGPNATLNVSYYRVDKITILPTVGMLFPLKVSLQNPPHSHDADLHDDIQLQITQPLVLTSTGTHPKVQNEVKFVFAPIKKAKRVKAGPKTTFTVTFVYARDAKHGYGALTTTTIASGNSFQVNPGTNAGDWVVTKGTEQQNPSWALKPPDGKAIVGTGAEGSVEFLVDGIITDFPPGPTAVLVSYENIPGYQGGTFYGLIQKVPHVEIKSLNVTPNPAYLDENGAASVTVRWETENASALTLMPGSFPVTGKRKKDLRLTETTPISLTANGQDVPDQDNRAIKHITATILPVINSFDASPTAIYQKDFVNKEVYFSWNVNAAANTVQLKTSTGITRPEAAIESNLPIQINGPELVTLTAGTGEDKIERKVLISAFTPQNKNYAISPAPIAVAASPSSEFVAAVTSEGIVIVDTIVFQKIGDTIPTGSSPKSLAFSPDGDFIFVANSGDGTISIIKVTSDEPPFTFNSSSKNVGGSPQHVAVSNDGEYVFLTIDRGDAEGELVILKKAGHTYTKDSSITVGKAPRAVAVSPDMSQVFTANSGDDTVSVIGISQGIYTYSKTITGFDPHSQPTGAAVTTDSAVLLVSCAGSGKVYAIDTDYPDITPKKEMTVGSSPQQISVLSTGGYAFVSNQTSGTVSLIGCSNGIQNCKVLEASIEVGGSPGGIAATPEGGMVLVANGDGHLNILTLAQYLATEPVPVGVTQYPTDVAVSADGSTAFVWHNFLLNIEGVNPADIMGGIYVVEKRSGGHRYKLQDDKLINCIPSPEPVDNKAILAPYKKNEIWVLNTETFEIDHKFTIPPAPKLAERLPLNCALSEDGSKLFVLLFTVGENEYTMIVYDADISTNTFTVNTDLKLYNESGKSIWYGCCAAPDGSAVYVVDSIGSKLYAVQQQANGAYKLNGNPVELGNEPTGMTITPDGSRLFILNTGGMVNSITVVDTTTLETAGDPVEFPQNNSVVGINALAMMPDGSRLLATDAITTGIHVMDPRSLRFVQTISWETNAQNPYGLTITPDGSTIYTANLDSHNLGIIGQVQPAGA